MFLVFLFFWTIAVFLWISDERSVKNFFGGCAFFFFGCGGLSALLEGIKVDHLWLRPVIAILSSLMYFWGPCSIFLYALFSQNLVPGKTWKRLLLIQAAMIPAELAYFVFPALTMFSPIVKRSDAVRIHDTRVMTYLMTPYFVLTLLLLVGGWLFEKDRAERENRATNVILIVPALCALYLTSYIIPSTGIVGAWQWNIVLLVMVSVLFVVFGVRKSALGIHFYHENVSKVQTQQAVIQSAGVLQHAIKNNLLTVRLALQNAKYRADQNANTDEQMMRDLSQAIGGCEHTLAILDRISLQFRPVRIAPEWCSFLSIADEAIEQSRASNAQKTIQIQREWLARPKVYCDPVHMHEAVLNLVNNAVEAVADEGEGKITVKVFMRRRRLVLQISDNGCGISDNQWRYIGTPLFTTKKGSNHYGLGLFYVQKVAELHQGKLDIRSSEGAGTYVELILPPTRLGEEDTYAG